MVGGAPWLRGPLSPRSPGYLAARVDSSSGLDGSETMVHFRSNQAGPMACRCLDPAAIWTAGSVGNPCRKLRKGERLNIEAERIPQRETGPRSTRTTECLAAFKSRSNSAVARKERIFRPTRTCLRPSLDRQVPRHCIARPQQSRASLAAVDANSSSRPSRTRISFLWWRETLWPCSHVALLVTACSVSPRCPSCTPPWVSQMFRE